MSFEDAKALADQLKTQALNSQGCNRPHPQSYGDVVADYTEKTSTFFGVVTTTLRPVTVILNEPGWEEVEE